MSPYVKSIFVSLLLILLLPVTGISQKNTPAITPLESRLPTAVLDSLIKHEQENALNKARLQLLLDQRTTLLNETQMLSQEQKASLQQVKLLTLQKEGLTETVQEKDKLLIRQGKKLTFVQWQRNVLSGSTVILLLMVLSL